MNVRHDRSYISESDVELIQRGYAREDLTSLRFSFVYTQEEINANIAFNRNCAAEKRMENCVQMAQKRSEAMAPIMAAIADRFKCYQYADDKQWAYGDSGWDLFFWCNCFYNTLRGLGVSGRDYSYFTLSFNETHSPEKRKELCDAVVRLINEKFPEHPNLEITIQHEAHRDHSRIAAEAKHIAPKLDGLKCVYHAKEGRIVKVGDDYYFMKKHCRTRGYQLGVLDILRIAWSMGLSTEVAS